MDTPSRLRGKPGGRERRQSPRARLEQLARIRADDAAGHVELRKTHDVSRSGFFFTTRGDYYYVGMHLYVVLGFQPDDPVSEESLGEVVRVEKLDGGEFGVAVHILMR